MTDHKIHDIGKKDFKFGFGPFRARCGRRRNREYFEGETTCIDCLEALVRDAEADLRFAFDRLEYAQDDVDAAEEKVKQAGRRLREVR